MTPPDRVLRTLVQQWIAKAELDFRAAERLIQDTEPIREVIAFHCQQVAEKYIKAFLVDRQLEFPKTHDLEELIELVTANSPELALELQGCEILSPFGVRIRYPGDFPEVLAGQEVMLFELARRVRDAVTAHLEV